MAHSFIMAMLQYFPWLHIDHTKGAKVLKESPASYRSMKLGTDVAPNMTLLVGRKAKSAMLRHLLPDIHRDCFADPHGQAFLWRDAENEGHIFIDFELHNYDKATLAMSNRLDAVTTRTVDWMTLSGRSHTRREFGTLLSGRALAPMCQVLCYFASDLGGLRGVATLLAAQILPQPASDLPRRCLPRVLIVVDTAARAFDPSAVRSATVDAIDQILRERENKGVGEADRDATGDAIESRIQGHFYDIHVIGLPRSIPPVERAVQLRARLSILSRENIAARKAHGMCLQRDHFFAMVGGLLDHFLISWTEPFSFVKASRPADFTLDELPFHLKEIISLLPAQVWLNYLVCPLLASAIRLANYPPGSHRKRHVPQCIA